MTQGFLVFVTPGGNLQAAPLDRSGRAGGRQRR